MIGGVDVIMKAPSGPQALEVCVRAIRRHWPEARYENAETGDKFRHYRMVPFGQLSELLVYVDPKAEASWDADSSDSPVNSMIYLISSAHSVTAVVDDPNKKARQHQSNGRLRRDAGPPVVGAVQIGNLALQP